MAEQGRYLYAVCRGVTPEAVDGIVGLGGGRVDLVSEGDLVGLVSPVDLDEYGEEGLRRNLERIEWLEAAARGHDAVVQAAAAIAPTAPTRLATIFLDDEGVRRRLREQRAPHPAALAFGRHRDHAEVRGIWRVARRSCAGRGDEGEPGDRFARWAGIRDHEGDTRLVEFPPGSFRRPPGRRAVPRGDSPHPEAHALVDVARAARPEHPIHTASLTGEIRSPPAEYPLPSES